jgi:hypothetical protein
LVRELKTNRKDSSKRRSRALKNIKELLKNNLHEFLRHLEVIQFAFNKLSEHASFPLTSEDLIRLRQDLNALSLLDSIAYRFSKLQETLVKILRLYLAYQGEEVEEIFMRDVINLAEKRGLPINWSK